MLARTTTDVVEEEKGGEPVKRAAAMLNSTPMPTDDTAPEIHLRLLGPLTILLSGRQMQPLRSRRGLHLLALLALHANRPLAREWLAGALWPDSQEEQALSNLRRTLTDLRRALGSCAARISAPAPSTLSLRLEAQECDVLAFDQALALDRPEAWRHAVALYHGPLLADSYELWIEAERTTRQEGHLRALEHLAEHERAQGAWREAAHFLRLAIAADPLRESLSVALMEALAEGGDFAEALQVYRALRVRLHEAFAQSEPGPQAVALYRRLRAEAQSRPAAPPPSPPEPTAPVLLHNLPQYIASFVGREKERAALNTLLSTTRLVTLTGPGGIGKTRLALEAAQENSGAFADGVRLVELAALSEATLVPNAVAEALGLPEEPGKPILETVQAALRSRKLLLLLDNCEHLPETSARLVSSLLHSCPGLHILVTSQRALGITGEALYPVQGLELPPPPMPGVTADKGGLLTLTEYAAIQLFMQRAQAVLPSFRLTAHNSDAVIEICRRLDGIPLALELAAARLKVLTVEQIAQKLDDRFYLLTGGSRTVLPRHQTLQAALDWSYDLLGPDEQALLQRLSVFVGGATLTEVEALCADNLSLAQHTLDLLQQLVDKSFVWAEPMEAWVRYRLLETTRAYALQKLESSGEGAAIRQRQSAIYADLLAQAAPELQKDRPTSWLDRLMAENDNLRASLEWLIRPEAEQEDVQHSRQMIVSSLFPLWRKRLRLQELAYWAERVLQRDPAPTALRTDLEMVAGWTALWRGEVVLAHTHFENAHRVYLAAENRQGELWALNAFGKLAEYQGDHQTARDLYARCLAGHQERNDEAGISSAINNLGTVAWLAGDYPAARAYHEECLARARRRGSLSGIAWSLNNLAEVAQAEGNRAEAGRLFKESMAVFVNTDQRLGIADCLQGLGEIACAGPEDVAGARIAARLLGAADAMRTLAGIAVPPNERPMHERALLQAQQALEEAVFRREWAVGSAMSLEEAILSAEEV